MRKYLKQTLAFILSLMLLLSAGLICGSAAEDGIPLTKLTVDPIVRVHLSRLGLTDRLDVTTTAPYGLRFGSEDAELYLESGSRQKPQKIRALIAKNTRNTRNKCK